MHSGPWGPSEVPRNKGNVPDSWPPSVFQPLPVGSPSTAYGIALCPHCLVPTSLSFLVWLLTLMEICSRVRMVPLRRDCWAHRLNPSRVCMCAFVRNTHLVAPFKLHYGKNMQTPYQHVLNINVGPITVEWLSFGPLRN